MIYLRKVIALIENKKYLPELEKLGRVLMEAGLEFLCLQEEGNTNICGGTAVQQNAENGANKRKGQSVEGKQERVVTEGEESVELVAGEWMPSLWLTDSAEWASLLRLQKEAVLALLHEDNHNQNFSGILYACENVGELDADYMEKVYRRYVNLPWDITETDRCMIRETTEEDVDVFWEIYQNGEITRFTEGLYPTIEKEKQYVTEYREKVYGFYGFGVWTILKKDTGEIIGRAGFSYREGYEEPEIGFVIGVPWQGKGYAYEVCSALLKYAKEEMGFNGVNAFVQPENKASLVLCKKLGMEITRETFISGHKHLQLQRIL